MNHKIKIALALITGGTLVYLSRKMKNSKNEPETFTGEDGKVYQKDETYLTADGKMYKNGKEVHLKTPETSEKSVNRNFQNDRIQKNYEAPKMSAIIIKEPDIINSIKKSMQLLH
ncbi:hypothetical protein [uncultured Chryseobacterium sp.]|uniref:hypothetical protein n=1 Tax=uncultured Chryseobacterium sp. TaxID=259322 RepID=UPI00258513D2|nr:hypothetical protein [uncultured Chryseobacterium sp.]